MPSVRRPPPSVLGGAALCLAWLLAGCATTVVAGHKETASASMPRSQPVAVESPEAVFGPEDREGLDDFCGWYNQDLDQSMDTISAFLGVFGSNGGDYNDPDVTGPAQDAAQAAGDVVDALNGFLTGFPVEVTDGVRRAVTSLRDAISALASAIRDQKGPDEINAKVAVFDEAHKALLPLCV